jgi:hypothetical protein
MVRLDVRTRALHSGPRFFPRSNWQKLQSEVSASCALRSGAEAVNQTPIGIPVLAGDLYILGNGTVSSTSRRGF